MDKQLHIHILDALRQGNAIGQMVDIKPAFLDELDSQEKRKNFKAQLDYLVSEGLIETPSKYEFLGWELLTGLYNIDNKKIEARLVGRWESFLSSRGNIKRAPVNLPPPPEPEAPKVKKLGLYDAPSTVLPYPGVNLNKPQEPTTTPAKQDEGEPIFASKRGAPAPVTNPDADVFLKEDDFLPFKTRAQARQQAPATPPQPKPVEDPYAAKISTYTPPKEPEPVKEEPLPAEPVAEEPKADVPEFSASKVAYTPPKTESNDIAVTVTPFTPPPPQPQAWEAEDKPAAPTRISATVKRKVTDEEEDVPIITARTAGLRAKVSAPQSEEAQPAAPESPLNNAPAKGSRVVNLTSAATVQSIKTVEPMIPLRSASAPQQQPLQHQPLANSHSIPPPPSNFAAIRFDTDNNPFAGLGTINLAADEEAKPKKSPVLKVLKWTAIIFVILIAIVVAVLYKMRYG